MNFHLSRAVTAIVLLFCALPYRVCAQVEPSLKADTSKKCAICHYKWVSTFFLEQRSTPIAQPGEKSLEAFSREMCISCHDASVRDSRSTICNDPGHRVGRLPSKQVNIPPEYPLDENGALKCTTCHTPHAVIEESESMVEYFLRAPNENSAFCKTCHKNRLGGLETGNHPIDVPAKTKTDIIVQSGGKFGIASSNQIICETCHKAHGGVNNKFLVLPIQLTKSQSVLCEACHTKNAVRPGAAPGKMRSHPVDVRPGKGVQILPTWPNGGKVVVGERGEIVCRTCHKPHQAHGEFLLANKNGKDALCAQCHRTSLSVAGALLDSWISTPTEQNNSSKASAESFACSSCHHLHDANAAFLFTSNAFTEGSDYEQFFRIPHFELHPRMFFGSTFITKDSGRADGIFLFTKNGDVSDNGTIACATCHNLPLLDPGTTDSPLCIEGAVNSTTSLLRPDIAEKFCKTCHGHEALVRFLYFHEKW